jgi:hypothetical protein
MFHRNEFLLPSSKTAMPAAHQQGNFLLENHASLLAEFLEAGLG